MFKALLKKQFLELNSTFFVNRKDGKKKSKGGAARSIALFVVIMVFVGVMFYILTGLFAESLLIAGPEMEWFYFALMSLLALILGTFGSVFNTMAALYKAKDNELLLSLPIPPRMILIVRMIGVYAMSLLYSALVWVPTVVRYWVIKKDVSGSSAAFCVILTFLIALLVTVLSCAVGWIVAAVSTKLRNRSVVTVIISLVIFGLYYFVCFRLNSILSAIVAHNAEISAAMKTRIYPIYALGQAAAGDGFSMAMFTLIVAALFLLCCVLLSRSFIRIVTTNKGMKKAVYKEQRAKYLSPSRALFGRELRHFTKSATYMLNCGLGLVLLPALAIVMLFYRDLIDRALMELDSAPPFLLAFVPVAVCAVICLISAMNMISAPSVSLEGRSIWIAQTLPVAAKDVLYAKLKLHIVLNLPPAVFSTVLIGWLLHFSPLLLGIMLLTVILFTVFSACFGLRLNLKHPNLSWNNESVPIKQSLPIFIGMFGGWGLCIAVTIVYLFLTWLIPSYGWLLICCGLLALVICLQLRWIRGKGAKIFAEL